MTKLRKVQMRRRTEGGRYSGLWFESYLTTSCNSVATIVGYLGFCWSHSTWRPVKCRGAVFGCCFCYFAVPISPEGLSLEAPPTSAWLTPRRWRPHWNTSIHVQGVRLVAPFAGVEQDYRTPRLLLAGTALLLPLWVGALFWKLIRFSTQHP